MDEMMIEFGLPKMKIVSTSENKKNRKMAIEELGRCEHIRRRFDVSHLLGAFCGNCWHGQCAVL